MSSVDFLGFEGFALGAVVEGVGDGFFFGRHFFATGIAEVIEASCGNEKGIAVFGEGLFDVGVGSRVWKLHRDVAAGSGKLWEGIDLEEVALEAEDFFELEFSKVDRRVERDVTGARREELRVGADGLTAELDVAREEEAIARAGGELNLCAAEGVLYGGLEVEEIELTVLTA